jgi:hypothetical protein
MKRFVRVFIAALSAMVLGSVVSLVPQNNPQEQGQGRPAAPVNLTEVSVPTVPVSGAVGVSNFPATLTGAAVPVSGNVTANINLPNPLPVQPIKQSAANFVTLCWGCQGPSGAQQFFAQVHDKSVDTTPFALSSGQQLVVTDVSWLAECPANMAPNCAAGQTLFFTLEAHYLSVATLDTSATPVTGRSDHLTSGFVVATLPGPNTFIPALQTGGTLDSVILQGYVVP